MSRESRMELIRRRGRNEHLTLIRKFLDHSKDPLRRLKALKSALERTKPEEVKEFFTTNSSIIFYVVYASFTTCEDSIQLQRGKKSSDALRDLSDLVLPTLEEILITLPELVGKQWQSNSICLIIRKLLHPQNTLPFRCCGIRLLVIWLQCLQGSGGSACLELFASIIPGFPPVKTQHIQPDDGTKPGDVTKQGDGTKQEDGTSTLPSSQTLFELRLSQQYGAYLSTSMPCLTTGPSEAIGVSRIRPLSVAPSNGRGDGSSTVELMRYLLECLTSQVSRLKWDAPSDHIRGFSFLFFVYKLLYLSAIYKGFHMGGGLYSLSPAPVLACVRTMATPHDTQCDPLQGPAVISKPLPVQEHFVIGEPSSAQTSGERLIVGEVSKSSDKNQVAGESTDLLLLAEGPSKPLEHNTQYGIYQMAALIEKTNDVSSPVCQRLKQVVLEFVLQWLMSDNVSNAASSASGAQANTSGVELMRRMLMSSRDNVSLLLEILKQGFVDTSFTNDAVLRNLISLYNKWMTTPERPIFMTSSAEGSPGNAQPQLEVSRDDLTVQPWEALSSWDVPYNCDVRAGLQPSLHMCVDHSSRMFLTQAKDDKKLSVQVDMCKRIIKLYQDIVTAWLPDQDTWSYILSILLHLSQELLIVSRTGNTLEGGDLGRLGDDLASELLKTLLLCFVRASLVVKVSPELWDSLLYVMSSLTSRREAIVQWKAVMETMTHVLAYSVYNLNLHNLPLNRAREDRHRPRSKTVIPSEIPRNTTFSKVSFFKSPALGRGGHPSEGGHSQTTSTPTRGRPASIKPLQGLPSPIRGDLTTAPEEGGSSSPPLPRPPHPTPNAGAQYAFQQFDAPDLSVIVNPHVLCTSPVSDPIGGCHVEQAAGEALVVKNIGCQETDPPVAVTHGREASTQQDGLDSDWDTKSTSSCVVLVARKLPVGNSSPPPAGHHRRESSPTTGDDGGTHSPSKVRTPSPVCGVKTLEHSVSSSSSSSLAAAATPSAVVERGNFLSKASSEGNLLGSSGGLFQQKSTRPLLLDIPQQKQEQHQQQHRSGIRRVVSTDMAHRSTEAVHYVEDLQQGAADTFSFVLRENEASSGKAARLGEGVLPWMRESSRFAQHPSWSQVLAAVVWQRMLKILGDINKIADPFLHMEAMSCLQSIWKSLFDIDANLGVSPDSQLPREQSYAPPLLLIFPWVVKACSLPDAYIEGRRLAYELLCSLVIKHSRTPCSLPHLAHFYRLMHEGLCGDSAAVRNVTVKSGCRLFSHGCQGSTVLLFDCIKACSTILNSKLTGSTVPRLEALTLVGSVLYLPELYPSVSTLENGVIETSFIKEQIVDTVLKAARQEPTRPLRCLALHLLGILVFKEFRSGQLFSRCDEAMDILLASLQFSDHGVALSAVDMLSLLREVFGDMTQLCPPLVTKVIKSLCVAAAVSMSNREQHQTVIPILLCLRDWFMMLPSMKEGGMLPPPVTATVFEVLHVAATGAPLQQSRSLYQSLTSGYPPVCTLEPIAASLKSPQSSHKGDGQEEVSSRIQMAARSVLTHLLNLYGHFPFGCGAAQLTSVVEEYHDSPSLDHLTELSSEVFDSPRVQFFALNKSSVITLVEIPSKLGGIPEDVVTSTYQTRVIVRDVTGKYCWDSAILYGKAGPYEEDTGTVRRTKVPAESEHLTVSLTPGDPPIHPSMDPSQHLSWKAHQGTSQDVLYDLLKRIENTSPECVIYPGNCSLTDPAPPEAECTKAMEHTVVTTLERYQEQELSYAAGAFVASSMCGSQSKPPEHLSGDSIQFQHCRVFLSHLGMLSWSRRNHLDLLKKDNQLILELRNLDQAHSRQTYKLAVLYVALGQEDKRSILRNTSGSREFEDFVAGLGWEVDLKTHAGYLGGLKKEFYTNCSLPYYATSSEEVLFHVATRMPSKGTDDDLKVRHLGNDEVHIVWSEHWRDYRRTIFKTQFADVLIVVYPQPSGLYRIQIDSKQGVSPSGPLFDGALVDRSSLPLLVRATAINILRAQRHPTVNYRRRYEERMKYIQTVIDQNLMKSSYEEFAQNVMHPLSIDDAPKPPAVELRAVSRPLPSSIELRPIPRPTPHIPDGSPAPIQNQSDTKRSSVTKISSLFSARRAGSSKGLTDRPESEAFQSQRTNLVEENRCDPSTTPHTTLQRNHSVPENLSEVSESHHVRSPSSSSQSNLHKKIS